MTQNEYALTCAFCEYCREDDDYSSYCRLGKQYVCFQGIYNEEFTCPKEKKLNTKHD